MNVNFAFRSKNLIVQIIESYKALTLRKNIVLILLIDGVDSFKTLDIET